MDKTYPMLLDETRKATQLLTTEQRLVCEYRDAIKAHELGVSIDDYLKIIGCRNI